MLKAVVAATAAVTIAGSSLPTPSAMSAPDGARRWQPTTEDMRAFQAARLAALRAGLTLTAEQERHWPAFEQAMRELQQLRLNRITAIREARRDGRQPVTDPAERMRQRATRLSESGAVLKRLADATDPLYRSLDDAQKRRFAILTRTEGPRGGWQRRGRDGGEPRNAARPPPHRCSAGRGRAAARPDLHAKDVGRRNGRSGVHAQDRRWRRVRPGVREQDRRRRHGRPRVRHQDRERRS